MQAKMGRLDVSNLLESLHKKKREKNLLQSLRFKHALHMGDGLAKSQAKSPAKHS